MSSKQLGKSAVMLALVKREFSENRTLFVYLPLLITLLVAIFVVVAMVKAYEQGVFLDSVRSFGNGSLRDGVPTMVDFAEMPLSTRERALDILYTTTAGFLLLGYWASTLFYFMMTLYQQRKDRSILFWNSMPVSDTQTIISKLVAGMVGCQGVYLGCAVLLHLFVLASSLVFGSMYDIDVWQTVGAPAHVFTRFFSTAVQAVVTLTWTLPVYAWLLLWSGWARSVPLVWAIGPFAVLVGIEQYFTETMPVTQKVVLHTLPYGVRPAPQDLATLFANFPATELLVSTLLGMLLVYAAVHFNRSEDI